MPISAFTASEVVTSPTSSTRSRNQPAYASSISGKPRKLEKPMISSPGPYPSAAVLRIRPSRSYSRPWKARVKL